MLKIFPLVEDLKLPTKAHKGDAGWDLYSRDHVILDPGERYQFKLGLVILGESDCEYRIEGKSGLALKHGITTIGNIIDNGYRGEITAILVNLGSEPYTITTGDKICQLIVSRIYDDNFLTVASELNDYTPRGTKGFGSSGK